MGQKRGLKWAGFWAADGTGYGDGLLRKTENRGKREKRGTGRYLQRGLFWRQRGVRVGDIQTRGRKSSLVGNFSGVFR